MGYVDKNLLPGEAVTYRANLHPMIFAAPTFFLALGVVSCVLGVAPLGVLLMLVAAIVVVLRYLKYTSSEFAITDKRVVIKVGLLRRRTVELLLSKVETIAVDQGILGRIFNYGTIVVTGTGGTKEPFKGIASPLEFRKHVQARLAV